MSDYCPNCRCASCVRTAQVIAALEAPIDVGEASPADRETWLRDNADRVLFRPGLGVTGSGSIDESARRAAEPLARIDGDPVSREKLKRATLGPSAVINFLAALACEPSDTDRKRLIRKVLDCYCLYCGASQAGRGRCQCSSDERVSPLPTNEPTG